MTPAGEIQCTALESVKFGRPAADVLLEEAQRLGADRVFLLASQALDSNTNEIQRIRDALGARCAGVYTGMPPHAPRSACLEAATQARNAKADLLVAVGGGSIVDAAKIVLICLQHDLHAHDDLEPFHVYVDADGEVIKPSFEGPSLRMIAVPTTLSGGEFNPLGGATDENRKIKQGYEHRLMAPVTVVLDPALTVHTPSWLWFSTGVRSLDHAMETLGSLQSNDYCDGIAESAIRLLVSGLKGVHDDPSDLAARLRCQIGVWQSMIPVIAGVPMGASHAIGHVLGGTCDVPHGYTSCVMAPFVLRFNSEINGERQRRISAAFGAPERPAHELADEFIRGLGMPRSLQEVGVAEADLERIAEYTMEDFWARTNPRPIEGPSDVMAILRTAI